MFQRVKIHWLLFQKCWQHLFFYIHWSLVQEETTSIIGFSHILICLKRTNDHKEFIFRKSTCMRVALQEA